MGIQNWSDSIILVNLAEEPYLGEELQTTLTMITEKTEHDVVIDFAGVSMITSSSLAKLLKLRKAIQENGHKLILCGVKPQTKGVLRLTGLDKVFNLVEDQFMALAGLQMAN
jgi:anti-anti-sigma factor